MTNSYGHDSGSVADICENTFGVEKNPSIKTIFIVKFYVNECLPACQGALCVQCLKRPEEGIRS